MQRQGTSPISKTYICLLYCTFLCSSIVFIEPSPYDGFMIILLTVAFIFSYYKYDRYMITPIILLWVFLLGNVVSLFFSDDELQAFRYFAITLYLIISWLFFLGLFSRLGPRTVENVFHCYSITAVISVLLSIGSYFGFLPLDDFLLYYGLRLKGFFKDPNVFSAFLIPVSLYAFYRLETAKSKPYWFLHFLILVAGLVLCFSRAAWIHFFIAVSTYVFLRLILSIMMKKNIRFIFVYCGMGLILLLLLSLFIQHRQVADLLFHRLHYQDYDSARFATQILAFNKFMEQPFGYGPGQSELILDYATHSLYMRILIENGLISLICFTCFILVTLYHSLKKCIQTLRLAPTTHPLYVMYFALIVGLLINSLVIDTLHWRHFWFIFALPWTHFSTNEEQRFSHFQG